jgi:hypothetical protein
MKWFSRRPLLFLLLAALLCFSIAGSASAFQDIQDDPEKQAIELLLEDGIVSGVSNGKFAPQEQLTVGNAVALIVKGLDLSLAQFKFIKEPLASDYFTKVKNNAWYAQAFVIASVHDLGIPKDIDPESPVTKEQFAHWLYKALTTKGDYAWEEIYLLIADEADINAEYMNSIQRLLIGKIAQLDKDGNFLPKKPITRSEAAGWLQRTRTFVKNVKPVEPLPQGVLSNVTLKTEKVNEDIVKFVVTAQAPHPGYGIEIANISFEGNKAIIAYRATLPDPDTFYVQVITEVKAEAYASARYKGVLGGEVYSLHSPGAAEAGPDHAIDPDRPVSSAS